MAAFFSANDANGHQLFLDPTATSDGILNLVNCVMISISLKSEIIYIELTPNKMVGRYRLFFVHIWDGIKMSI